MQRLRGVNDSNNVLTRSSQLCNALKVMPTTSMVLRISNTGYHHKLTVNKILGFVEMRALYLTIYLWLIARGVKVSIEPRNGSNFLSRLRILDFIYIGDYAK